MLGGAILLIVVVLFFGIRAFMGSGKGDSSKDTADEQVTADNDQGNCLLYTSLPQQPVLMLQAKVMDR